MGLKLDQTLVGHSLNLCSIFIPVHLVGRINFGLRFCEWFGVPLIPLGVPSGYRRWPLHSPYLSGAFPVPGLKLISEMPSHQFLFSFIALSWALPPPHTWSPSLFPFLPPSPTHFPPPSTSNVYFISLLSEIQASSFGSSLLLSFYGSVDCSMSILYFMATVHL